MKKNLFWLTVLTTVLFVCITNNIFTQTLGNNILDKGDFEIDYHNVGTEAAPIYAPLYGYRIPKAKGWLSASLGLFKLQSSTDVEYVYQNQPYPDNMNCASNNKIISCDGWFKPINNWNTQWQNLYPFCPYLNEAGSPDYFHKHGENNDCNWNNVIDYRQPANGEGYAGFLLTQNIACNNPNDVTPLWKEYLQIKLPNLKVGVYRVSFQVSKAQANSFPNECPPTNHTINEIGAYFSNEILQQDGAVNSFNNGAHPNFNNNPFISSGSTQITGEPDANGEGGWETIAGDLTVTQNNQYKYMTIGNFSSNLWANVSPSATSTDYIRMYYFVDDVQIQRYNNCSYNIQITKEDCAVISESGIVGVKYHITITSNGENCEYNSYRLFQKGGIGYDNSKGEWTPITLLMSSSNSIDYTVYYSNDDIGKKVGLKIALYKETLGSETLLTEEPLEFIKESCYPSNSECCPPGRYDWLNISIEKGADGCLPNQYSVKPTLTIPQGYMNCSTDIIVSTKVDGSPLQSQNFYSFEDIDMSDFNQCIDAGRNMEVNVSFFLDGAENPCPIKKTVYAPVQEGEPCTINDECQNIPWEDREPIHIEVKDCPNCFINVMYKTRKACGKQEVQITLIEKEAADQMLACCVMGIEQLYLAAVERIVFKNEMGFDPTLVGGCDNTWRIGTASCWATWIQLISKYDDPLALPKVIEINKPCLVNCCRRMIEVCRISNHEISIRDLGPDPLLPPVNCVGVTYSNTTQSLSCYDMCSSLENINSISVHKESSFENNSIIKNEKDDFKVKRCLLNISNDNNLFRVLVDNYLSNKIEINFYNLNGELLINNSQNLNKGMNTFDFDLNRFNSGTYLYNIIIDGYQVKSDKFIFVK